MVSTSLNIKAWPICLLALLFVICFFEGYEVVHLKQELIEQKNEVSLLRRENESQVGRKLDRKVEDKMYFYVHLAKIGGSTINGMMANTYEKVCGNKGYSYKAYQANEQAKEAAANLKGGVLMMDKHGGLDRSTPPEMKEWGYEDCEWMADEGFVGNWKKPAAVFREHGWDYEFHVACRDPIDHLLSMCNAGQTHFIINCDGTDEEFYRMIDKCAYKVKLKKRFSAEYEETFPGKIKCLDFKKQFTTYIDFMGDGKLQKRRIISEPFVQREVNDPRDKEAECLLHNPAAYDKAKAYLLETFYYYQFCQSCLGTKDDILHGYGATDEY